jgi:hypothetical protein
MVYLCTYSFDVRWNKDALLKSVIISYKTLAPTHTYVMNPLYETVAGLPDFSWYNIPKWGKICQMITKYTKWPKK